MLSARGAVLVDADEIARAVVEPGGEAWSKIVEHFGRDVLLPDKRINRELLAEIVFADLSKRTLLNQIVHPEVMRVVAERMEELRSTDRIVVCDIPLLVEVGATDMFDVVVVVAASTETQVARLHRTRGMPGENAEARIAAQAPMAEKVAVADVIISNDGSRQELTEQVDRLWDMLEAKRAR
jgi:dephospho-CoA kinase